MKDITIEEAVDQVKERIVVVKRHIKNYEESKCETSIYNELRKEAMAFEKVLNELENKDGTKYALLDALKERTDERDRKDKKIREKDKIINAMALQLAGISIWDDKKEVPTILMTEEEVKKYYEGKVKNDYEENYKSISNN